MKTRTILALALILVMGLTSVVLAKPGNNGTTLAGYKTIDICSLPDGNWRYSGEIAVWNEGAIDTVGLNITDFIEYKTGPKWIKAYDMTVTPYPFGEIPAGTTMETATIFDYTYDGAPLPGTIRNNVSITILNHSNFIGKLFGPNPKATYYGPIPPPPCEQDMGCTYTQGYWSRTTGQNPPVWPAPYSRDALFFLLLTDTWQQVLDTPVNVSQGYYQLAHQYIAAVLNQANGAYVPQGVQDTLNLAYNWLSANGPSACTGPGSCGTQKTWAGVLDTYNNGLYEGGPPHCE
jgi:hypothetical protein